MNLGSRTCVTDGLVPCRVLSRSRFAHIFTL